MQVRHDTKAAGNRGQCRNINSKPKSRHWKGRGAKIRSSGLTSTYIFVHRVVATRLD